MPFCPTGQEFLPEYNVSIFEPKLANRIFSGPRKKLENALERKKKSLKFCTKMTQVPTG